MKHMKQSHTGTPEQELSLGCFLPGAPEPKKRACLGAEKTRAARVLQPGIEHMVEHG